jgi:hypothetical protein
MVKIPDAMICLRNNVLHTYCRLIMLVAFITGLAGVNNAVFGQCDPTVPSFAIDMTGHPDSLWTSPAVGRNGQCCIVGGPDVCIQFIVTLDKDAVGVTVDLAGGSGSTMYTVNCANPTPTGSAICLRGTGPFLLTLCKPGGNLQTYTVKSIAGPVIKPSIAYIGYNCQAKLEVQNMIDTSIRWTSLGNSTYKNALSCTTKCSKTTATFPQNYPTYVDYVACGKSISACITTTICDTVRVYHVPAFSMSLSPKDTGLCGGIGSMTITASPTGGKKPYFYRWNNGTSNSFLKGGVGTYSVTARDTYNCRTVTDTAYIRNYPLPNDTITGSDTVCTNTVYSYNASGVANQTYTWTISGGSLVTGQGTTAATVNWGSVGSGSIQLLLKNLKTGCSATKTFPISIKNRPSTGPIQH